MAGRRLRIVGRYTITVELHPARDSTYWLIWRNRWRAGDRDRSLLTRGALSYDVRPAEPRNVANDLRRIAAALDRLGDNAAASAAPEPPRGGYGGDRPLPGVQPPDWVTPHVGGTLDTRPE